MNSESLQQMNNSNQLGILNHQPTSPSNNSLNDFNDAPLDWLLEQRPETMTPEQLTAYIKRCSVLRSSAQTRKATLKAEGGITKKKAKSTVEQAMELLTQLSHQK